MVRRKRGRKACRILGVRERELVAAWVRAGGGQAEVASEFDVSIITVQRIRDAAVLAGRRVADSGFRLSFVERERISRDRVERRSWRSSRLRQRQSR